MKVSKASKVGVHVQMETFQSPAAEDNKGAYDAEAGEFKRISVL